MRFDPFSHVHSLLVILYFHKSFRSPPPPVPTESRPFPPKSQRFPDASVQLTGPKFRTPGTLAGAAVPSVPYVPFWLGVFAFAPLIHAHSLWPQFTTTAVTLALAAPLPFATPQVCAGLEGGVETVTA